MVFVRNLFFSPKHKAKFALIPKEIKLGDSEEDMICYSWMMMDFTGLASIVYVISMHNAKWMEFSRKDRQMQGFW